MLICAITSCIVPNTQVQVSSLSSTSRLQSAVDNILFLNSLNLFDHIVFADPSLSSNQHLLQLFESSLGNLTSVNSNCTFLYPKFNNIDHEMIKNRGKGLSELLILKSIISFISSLDINDAHIVKISARYKIYGLKKICNKLLTTDHYDFAFELCSFLSQVNTICFASRLTALSPVIDDLILSVDDSNSQYVERLFFNMLYLNSFLKCINLPPFLIASGTFSGSHEFQHSYIQQFKRLLLSFL